MCNHNALPLSLNGDTFNALKSDFDSILRNTLSNMELKGADTAEMNIKLKISLTKDQTRDFEARYDGAMRDIVKPKFEHVVQSVLQIKDKKDGTLSDNYELVWDSDEQKYVMREITDGQTSLFDKDRPIDGQVIVDVDCKVIDDEQPALRGRKVAQLPAPEPEGESGQTPFEWLKQFVDEPMKVMESMGIYTVRTKDNRVVLTSAAAESPFYCPAEKLADHIDHEIVCLARYAEAASFDEPGEITGISIWCDECQEVIFSMEKDGAVLAYGEDEASDAPDDYGYDEPEEEE